MEIGLPIIVPRMSIREQMVTLVAIPHQMQNFGRLVEMAEFDVRLDNANAEGACKIYPRWGPLPDDDIPALFSSRRDYPIASPDYDDEVLT